MVGLWLVRCVICKVFFVVPALLGSGGGGEAIRKWEKC